MKILVPEFCQRVQFRSISTISDIWHNVLQFLNLPGNLAIDQIQTNPKLAHFFEVECSGGGSGLAIFISIVAWMVLLIILGSIDQ
jgi:hypothetical protein